MVINVDRHGNSSVGKKVELKPFDSARLKIRRAKMHLAETEASIQAYLQSKPIAIVVEQPEMWKDLDCFALVARVNRPLDPFLSAVIGDCLHNLRASLDLMATDLVKLNGKDAGKVHFPFAKNKDDLNRQLKDRHMTRASGPALDLVRELKPYPEGNQALCGLHELDILDKHSAVIPAVSAVSLPSFTIFMGSQPNVIPEWKTAIGFDGQTLVVMPRMGNLAIGAEIEASFDLVFDEGMPFRGMRVREVLVSLCDYVPTVVDLFATLCAGQDFPM